MVLEREREKNGKFQNTLLHQSISVINWNYLKTSHTNNFLPCRGEWGNLSAINTDANCLQITMLLVQRSVSLPWRLKTADVRNEGRRLLALGTACTTPQYLSVIGLDFGSNTAIDLKPGTNPCCHFPCTDAQVEGSFSHGCLCIRKETTGVNMES